MGYRGAMIYAFAVAHNIILESFYAPGTRSGGGPVGLPSGGSGDGCTIGGGPVGLPSGPLAAAIRVAGTAEVARSSATARQRRLIFTV